MAFNILTFNWHESYLYLLSKIGVAFDVVEVWKGGKYGWIKEFRPVPPNFRLITEEEALANLKAGKYDRVIAHNLHDLSLVYEFPIPKILLHHNKSCVELGISEKEELNQRIEKLRDIYNSAQYLNLVYVSKAKKQSWNLGGEVILPGIDPVEFSGWRGHTEKVLRIGNLLKERDWMLGYSLQEQILGTKPSIILGYNPQIPNSLLPGNWNELREYLRRCRIYLNTTLEPYEDGYNLAMLEAMATEMPIVSISNSSSPIEDGVNGYISADTAYLTQQIEKLLHDHNTAKRLGEKARETVLDQFSIETFIENWKRILEIPCYSSRSLSKTGKTKFAPEKLKILMSYTSAPPTTATYLERALRVKHDVITYGPTITEEIIKEWNLDEIRHRVRDHDIPYFTPDITEVIKRLPQGWIPDLFLWIETGISYSLDLDGLENLPFPAACYLIDTHLHLQEHLQLAARFHFTFIAQREYLQEFKKSGIRNVFWLPLACDPEIHGKKKLPKAYDVTFVGSLNNQKRIDLLNRLGEKFDLHYERCFFEKMSETFSRSKIVFNNSVKNDLNMRVFEALCSGSMLITDEARGSGLTDLFQDGKHLVIYHDENELVELVEYYLEQEEKRELIAQRGMKEVLSKHTYENRATDLITIILSTKKKNQTFRSNETLCNHSESIVLQLHKDEPSNNPNIGRNKLSNDNGGAKQLNPARNSTDYYAQERHDIESIIPTSCVKILDVGCGKGVLGKRLLQKGVKEVVGIEIVPHICNEAKNNLSRAICGNVEEIALPYEEGYFDCIILADILEHLKEPWSILKKLALYLSDSGTVVASIPNVRYYGVINMLVEGRWKYEDYGILDRTHLRFFTKKEIEEMFHSNGFEIEGMTENIDPAYYSLEDPLARSISFGRLRINDLTPDELRDLFVVQYLIRARKTNQKLGSLSVCRASSSKRVNFEKMKNQLESYLERHPADLDTLVKHAEVCHSLRLFEEAMESIEKVLLFDPLRKSALQLKDRILSYESQAQIRDG